MSLLFQDVIVTTVAIGAAFVLVTRVRNAVAASRKAKCGSCPGCEEPGRATISSQARM